jgi:4,5-dihydroxyphthalate decarboxylase
MSKSGSIEVGFPIVRYDITLPLLQGRVEIEDVKLSPMKTPSMVSTENPTLQRGDFGLWDLNIGYLLPAIEAGWELVALPVFAKRKPAYQFIFCRADRDIKSPTDLEGKTIGSTSYRTALTVWCRGLLQHRHEVDVTKMRWLAQRGYFPIYDEKTQIESAGERINPVDFLAEGKVDAIITDISDGKSCARLESHPQITRLFPNYVEEDLKLYRESGIYTPVHVMVMSKKLDRQYPDLARKLYDAFEQSKKIAYDDVLNDQAGFSVVYLRERLKEQMETWGDPWKYGVEANRSTIDAIIQHNYEQGMTRGKLAYSDIFAAEMLAT